MNIIIISRETTVLNLVICQTTRVARLASTLQQSYYLEEIEKTGTLAAFFPKMMHALPTSKKNNITIIIIIVITIIITINITIIVQTIQK